MNLNIRRSPTIAPRPPMIAANQMFSGESVKKNPIPNGAEKSITNNIPPMKTPR